MNRHRLLELAAFHDVDVPVSSGDPAPVVLCSGPVTPAQHMERLIAAFHVLARYLEPAGHCVIAGTAGRDSREYAATLRGYVRQLALPRVHLLDDLTTEDRVACFQRADVLVSLADDGAITSDSLVTAMALHVPVLATDTAAHRRVLGDAAWFTRSIRATALAEAVHQIVRRPAVSAALRARGEARCAMLEPGQPGWPA